jgi:Holliday junction resolvasome RuvABC endonuclease subunit
VNEPVRGTTIIGVDASFGRTGVAVWRDGKVALDSAGTSSQESLPSRRRQIRSLIFRWAGPDPTLIVIEATYLHKVKGNSPLMLAGLHASIQDAAWRRNLPVVTPTPAQVKQFATGSGGASKGQMMDAAKLHLGITTSNDDEADALWLMAMGVYHYGWTVESAQLPPLDRVGMLDNYPWPIWSNGSGFIRPRWETPDDPNS